VKYGAVRYGRLGAFLLDSEYQKLDIAELFEDYMSRSDVSEFKKKSIHICFTFALPHVYATSCEV
jgi:hypothetical protein